MNLTERVMGKGLEYTLRISAPILPLLADVQQAYAQETVSQTEPDIPVWGLAAAGLMAVAAELDRRDKNSRTHGIFLYTGAGGFLLSAAAQYFNWR